MTPVQSQNTLHSLLSTFPRENNIPKKQEPLIAQPAGRSPKYTGNILNGMRHGNGTCEWEDGTKCAGQWAFGFLNGQATYETKTIKYVGTWLNGFAHGFGILTKTVDKIQTVISGQFCNGYLHGICHVTSGHATGEGKAVNGCFQGDFKVIKTLPDGSKRAGFMSHQNGLSKEWSPNKVLEYPREIFLSLKPWGDEIVKLYQEKDPTAKTIFFAGKTDQDGKAVEGDVYTENMLLEHISLQESPAGRQAGGCIEIPLGEILTKIREEMKSNTTAGEKNPDLSDENLFPQNLKMIVRFGRPPSEEEGCGQAPESAPVEPAYTVMSSDSTQGSRSPKRKREDEEEETAAVVTTSKKSKNEESERTTSQENPEKPH
jgi:hypothetical protein